MNGTEENRKEQHKLLFDVRRSVRYHTRRRQYFDRLNKFTKIFTLIGGLGTVTTLLAKGGEVLTLFFGTVAGFFSIVDIVLGTDEMAQMHGDLMREFNTIEIGMVLVGDNLTAEQIVKFTARRLEIEAKEPPKLQVLDVICYNELVKAMGYPKSYQSKPLSWPQKFFAPALDIFPGRLEKQES
ncbi:MAG TPA: hypothetical protein VG938_06205 [Verrucomicrobiae bacterium]|jgi:hypothetical protein|nr:hypothetical protein [Verrucomicrobiae bacterium]